MGMKEEDAEASVKDSWRLSSYAYSGKTRFPVCRASIAVYHFSDGQQIMPTLHVHRLKKIHVPDAKISQVLLLSFREGISMGRRPETCLSWIDYGSSL